MNKPFDRGTAGGSRSLVWLSAVLLAACATPPPGGPAPGASSPTRAPAPTTSPAPESAPPPPPETQAALSPAEANRSTTAALDFLQAGEEDRAEAELRRVLQSEPGNALAQKLMRQIKDDPAAWLGREYGRESFTYRVAPGESLSMIAKKFLNDAYLFYLLARYNGIKEPRKLASGQTIKVPGKAPPPTSSPAPVPGPPPPPPAPAPAPTPAPAPSPPPPPPPPPPPSPAELAKRKAAAIASNTHTARAAMARHDLDGTIAAWDKVLALDPDNRAAQLERQRAVDLKEKLGKVK